MEKKLCRIYAYKPCLVLLQCYMLEECEHEADVYNIYTVKRNCNLSHTGQFEFTKGAFTYSVFLVTKQLDVINFQ